MGYVANNYRQNKKGESHFFKKRIKCAKTIFIYGAYARREMRSSFA